jgi:hypothetical protein
MQGQYRIGRLFTITAIAAVASLVIARYARDVQESADRSFCHSNMVKIGSALQNYYDHFGVFPCTNVERQSGAHSWRVLLLPMLGRGDLFARYSFSEPWDGPHNRSLSGSCPQVLMCPRRDAGTTDSFANFVALVGPDTILGGSRHVRFRDIVSPQHTIVIVEFRTSDIHWMEPRDLNVELSEFPVASSRGDGKHDVRVLFADGVVAMLKSVGMDDLRVLSSVSASEETKIEVLSRCHGL